MGLRRKHAGTRRKALYINGVRSARAYTSGTALRYRPMSVAGISGLEDRETFADLSRFEIGQMMVVIRAAATAGQGEDELPPEVFQQCVMWFCAGEHDVDWNEERMLAYGGAYGEPVHDQENEAWALTAKGMAVTEPEGAPVT
jgi:hypothetical protein